MTQLDPVTRPVDPTGPARRARHDGAEAARPRPTPRRSRPGSPNWRRGSPNWRTGGGGPWPTLDNLRKRHARELEQRAGPERAEVRGDWLPVLDNLELALEHAERRPGRHRRGRPRGPRPGRGPAAGSASRARTTSGARSTRPGTRRSASVSPTTGAPPGTVVQVVRPGYGDGDRPAAARRRWSWPRGG